MPWDTRIVRLIECFPALKAIGNTPMVPVDVLSHELADVEVLAKMECLNPGGSVPQWRGRGRRGSARGTSRSRKRQSSLSARFDSRDVPPERETCRML